MGQDPVVVFRFALPTSAPVSVLRRAGRLRCWVPIAACLLVLLVGGPPRARAEEPPTDALDDARALLASGDLDGAVRKAREAIATTPDRGAAHLVLGLAHFRAGHFEEALAAFVAARTSLVPASPGTTAFNEGAALFALGRYAAARSSFEQAARVAPDLGFLATVGAAEAALAEGDLIAAQKQAVTAKALASTPEREQVVGEFVERLDREAREARIRTRETRREEARSALASDHPARAAAIYEELLLDTHEPALTDVERNVIEHGLGLALLRQSRHDEAARHFARAAALDPRDGDSLSMQGLAEYRAGAWTKARTLFRQALLRDVDAETAATARAFLDRLSFGGRRGGVGGSLGVSGGAGYDSNVIQGADARPETITADQVGSAGAFFATASANLGYEWLPGKAGFFAANYDLDQLAYPDTDHEDYSLQDHNLRLSGEWSPSSLFRLGLLGSEELQFSGLSGFRPFQNIVTVEPSVVLDELPYTSTNLRASAQKKVALDHDYDYYSGTRIDLRLGQRLRWRSVRGELAARHRRERIGVRTATLLQVGTSQTFKFRKRKPTDPVDEASYVYVAPYSYDSNAVLGSVEIVAGVFRFRADASAEILNFLGDSSVYFVVPTMNVNRLYQTQNRKDLRLYGSLSLATSLGEHVDLVLRYDVTDNRSTLVLDVDDRNYIKHVVAFVVEADW